MKIGELAKTAGISVQTIRYYEQCGLMRKPERKPSRYRVYGENDVFRLRFILKAKTLGFTLDEIKHVLELSEKQACPCGDVQRLAEERLARVEAEIHELSKFRDGLARAIKRWQKSSEPALPGNGICVLIEQTMTDPKLIQRKKEGKNGVQTRRSI